MKILLVNDDGIHAEGLHILAKELEKDYELTIIAPEEQNLPNPKLLLYSIP